MSNQYIKIHIDTAETQSMTLLI